MKYSLKEKSKKENLIMLQYRLSVNNKNGNQKSKSFNKTHGQDNKMSQSYINNKIKDYLNKKNKLDVYNNLKKDAISSARSVFKNTLSKEKNISNNAYNTYNMYINTDNKALTTNENNETSSNINKKEIGSNIQYTLSSISNLNTVETRRERLLKNETNETKAKTNKGKGRNVFVIDKIIDDYKKYIKKVETYENSYSKQIRRISLTNNNEALESPTKKYEKKSSLVSLKKSISQTEEIDQFKFAYQFNIQKYFQSEDEINQKINKVKLPPIKKFKFNANQNNAHSSQANQLNKSNSEKSINLNKEEHLLNSNSKNDLNITTIKKISEININKNESLSNKDLINNQKQEKAKQNIVKVVVTRKENEKSENDSKKSDFNFVFKRKNEDFKKINKFAKRLIYNKNQTVEHYQEVLMKLLNDKLSNEYLRCLASSFKSTCEKNQSRLVKFDENNKENLRKKLVKSRWDIMLDRISPYIPQYLTEKLRLLN